MGQQFEHGEKVTVELDGNIYPAHIEERFVSQSPSKQRDFFVIVNDGNPRFPISVKNFTENYGTIKKIISND